MATTIASGAGPDVGSTVRSTCRKPAGFLTSCRTRRRRGAAVVADRAPGLRREGGDALVVTVEDHVPGRRGGDPAEQPRRRVDLAEAVELVAHDVEQQAVPRCDEVDEADGPRLVQFED